MSTKTSHRRSAAEIKAMAYAIADEIETVALHYIGHGYSRKAALSLAIRDLAA
jgi:hypothetical protein